MGKLGIMLGALLVVGVAATGFAGGATKLVDFREQNFSITMVPILLTACGTTDFMTVTTHFRETSTVVWDNGHVETTMKQTDIAANSAGRRIVQAQVETIFVTGSGGLPLKSEQNIVATCGGASATPGLLLQSIFGFTVGPDGSIKEVHFHTR